MCVDNYGNMLPNKLMYVEDGDSWQRICVEELACPNSSVVYSSDDASSCAEKQALAIEAGDAYIPRCQSANTAKYDGCQCTVGDTTQQCRCVDEDSGDTITNKFAYVDDDDEWERVCVDELECSNSEVTWNDTSIPIVTYATTITCAEKQALAIEAGDTYAPRCQAANTALYDGCQCVFIKYMYI